MKTLYVHPLIMDRIKSGKTFPIVTRYEVEVGEDIEVETDREQDIIKAKVKSVHRKGSSLFLVEIENPITTNKEGADVE